MFNSELKVTSTFESTAEAHEDCPARFVTWNNVMGQCDIHDEWFETPEHMQNGQMDK